MCAGFKRPHNQQTHAYSTAAVSNKHLPWTPVVSARLPDPAPAQRGAWVFRAPPQHHAAASAWRAALARVPCNTQPRHQMCDTCRTRAAVRDMLVLSATPQITPQASVPNHPLKAHRPHLSCSMPDSTSSGGSSSLPTSSTNSSGAPGAAADVAAAASSSLLLLVDSVLGVMVPRGCPSSSRRAIHRPGQGGGRWVAV